MRITTSFERRGESNVWPHQRNNEEKKIESGTKTSTFRPETDEI